MTRPTMTRYIRDVPAPGHVHTDDCWDVFQPDEDGRTACISRDPDTGNRYVVFYEDWAKARIKDLETKLARLEETLEATLASLDALAAMVDETGYRQIGRRATRSNAAPKAV